MSNRGLYGTAAGAAVVAAIVFSQSPLGAQVFSTGVNDTAAAVEGAAWADNVTITMNPADNTFRFESDGIPSHGFAEKYLIPTNPAAQPFADKPANFFKVVDSSEYFAETPVDTTITTQPVLAEAPTETSLGRIGVALSGAQIFNDYENMERSVVAKDDQVIHDHVAFLDECNGHTLVDGTSYHYHGIPVCIAEAAAQPGAHSAMIGVLEDGFPVYANQDVGGVIVTNGDLDECSGHFGPTPEFAEGIYHYHLTADEAPYMIDCYHGEVEENFGGGAPGQGPDLAAVAEELGVSEDDLMRALGTTMPPDFAAAAQALGLSEEALRAAMPGPGR
ncbi:YHYH protein [Pseudooceanicola aestuarii]|uniref:YHYH protein n=1 Tax=Pseudooceanicola aestuarii TaxID=2697319 RepID=UPI0013D68D65|nr:YHYH protein [Pseudooceanicola aestuarii]